MSVKNPIKRVDEIRADVARLKAEQRMLYEAPRSRDEVLAIIDTTIDRWQAESDLALQREISKAALGQPIAPFLIKQTPNGTTDLAVFFLSIVGADAIRQMLVSKAMLLEPGMDRAARAARLSEIASECEELEVAEERLIMASEADGASIQRRGDARPEIVLGAL